MYISQKYEIILYNIVPKTLFIGKEVVWLSSCHSTNSYAMDLLAYTDVLDGTVVVAHEQTAGVGQRATTWESERGMNLTFSIILKPTWLPLQKQFYFSMAVAIAIQKTLSYYINDRVAIKWPNDIYVNDLKICGVLIQNTLKANNIKHSVVGIGININQQKFENTHATSMSKIVGHHFQLEDVLCVLLENLEIEYLHLKNHSWEMLKSNYESNLYRVNTLCEYKVGEEKVLGSIIGVEDSGHLAIFINNEKRFFDLKEIQYVF